MKTYPSLIVYMENLLHLVDDIEINGYCYLNGIKFTNTEDVKKELDKQFIEEEEAE